MNDVIESPDSTSLGAIGQPLRRKEDERLLTGRGRFSDDFTCRARATRWSCVHRIRTPES
jgi:hypothetical protein